MAENMLTKIPTPKVRANPLIMLAPIQKRMPAVIKLEILESLMESHARLKPSEMADCKFFPFLQLFFHSFKYQNVGVHRHTDGQDKSGDRPPSR